MTNQNSKFRRYRAQLGFGDTVMKALWQLVIFPFHKKGSPIDRNKVQVAWREVERLAQGSVDELKVAVVQADNIVDSVLRLKVTGETMGDRLKSAQDKFSYQTYQNLWEGHKLRNSIAHEAHFQVSQDQLKLAVSRFRQALQEIGIL